MISFTGENNYLISFSICKFAHHQRNKQSFIFMMVNFDGEPKIKGKKYICRKSVEGAKALSCQSAARKSKGFKVYLKRSEPKFLIWCANLVTNFKKCLTAVLANKGFSTKYGVMFCLRIKNSLHSVTSMTGYRIYVMCFL